MSTPQTRDGLAVVILTLDEQLNLGKAIASVAGQAPVVVVDSGSRDRTCDIAREHGATVLEHPFVDYASQRNFALQWACPRYDWVFFLDADEELTPDLWRDIHRAMTRDDLDGAYVRLDVRVLGHRLVHGEYSDAQVLRLMRPDRSAFTRGINERVDDREMRVSLLANRLIHRDARPLSHLFAKHIRYAQKEARAYFGEVGHRQTLAGFGLRTKAARMIGLRWLYNKMPLFVRPWVHYTRTVVLKGAWRDGLPGLLHAGMHTLWYPLLIDLLIYEEKLRRDGTLAREFEIAPSSAATED